ncbi:MAG: TatD family hydrolase, partial [Planctomycetota bacterium]
MTAPGEIPVVAFLFADSHAHLQFPDFDADRAEAVARARAAGVGWIGTVGSDLESSRKALALARENPGLFSTVGIHPHEAGKASEEDFRALDALAADPACRGVGETGFDYFYKHSEPESQRRAFLREREIAVARSLPVVIHIRDAWDDFFRVLESDGRPWRGVMHCFTGGPKEAERCLSAGLFLGFSGIATFKKADAIRAAAAACPLDRILVETDSPYLAPEPVRGNRCEPAFVAHTAAMLARLR